MLDLRDDKHVIHDVKTAAKSPGKDDADKSQQLSVYAYASRALDVQQGISAPDAGLQLTHLIVTEAGNASVVQQRTTRTNSDIIRTLARMQQTYNGIKAGVFPPTDPSNWWCSKKWCGYWGECPYADRRKP